MKPGDSTAETSRLSLPERAARPARFALLLLIGAAMPRSAAAEVREQLATTEYAVTGNPSASLLQLLNAASPVREYGRTFHGYTKWYVSWRYRWNESADGSCRISSVTTRVDGHTTLPRLVGGSAEQRLRFDTYLAALRIHELGHFAIAQQAGREIDAGILALPQMHNCATLESAANDFGRRVLNQHLAREKQYDATTEHGKSQGAWLER